VIRRGDYYGPEPRKPRPLREPGEKPVATRIYVN